MCTDSMHRSSASVLVQGLSSECCRLERASRRSLRLRWRVEARPHRPKHDRSRILYTAHKHTRVCKSER